MKMGTRAIVRLNGKLLMATHWDGYPVSLGKDLLKAGNDVTNILKVGSENHIDSVNPKYLDLANEVSIATQKAIIQKNNKILASDNVDKVDKQMAENRIAEAKDFLSRYEKGEQIDNISSYDDFAEWDYDVRPDGVYVATRKDSFKNGLMSKYRKLTSSNAEELDKRGKDKSIVDFSRPLTITDRRGLGSGWHYESARHRLARQIGYAKCGR
jgi:hypothetical protein